MKVSLQKEMESDVEDFLTASFQMEEKVGLLLDNNSGKRLCICYELMHITYADI